MHEGSLGCRSDLDLVFEQIRLSRQSLLTACGMIVVILLLVVVVFSSVLPTLADLHSLLAPTLVALYGRGN